MTDEMEMLRARVKELEAQVEREKRAPLSEDQRKALEFCAARGMVSVAGVQRKMGITWEEAYDLCQSLVDYGGLVDEMAVSPMLDQKEGAQ